ncbi:MAG: hypothetical protein E5W65_10905 [Mesorhizobium sp.]|uniref:hypothetical protein n=1 Tax=Mesorhizobium sp. TaxID=1871066 RepID=UPI00120F7499|nr:hypothetical protein [Mesorhizobium sp.]TIT36017.1 MAG: hypothetical protein E5W65_10905 [Mesorhizobium sp.]
MDGKDEKTGRFLPGNKLGGRTPGAISHRRRALQHLTNHGEAIIQTAITAALAGDTQLLSVLVKMLVPTGGIPAEIANGDPIAAYSEGEINSAELRQLMTSVEKARQLDVIHKGDSRSEPQRTTVLVDEDAAEVYRRMIET